MPELTTVKNARDAIEGRWLTEWVDGDGEPLTPFCFDNEEFKPPAVTFGSGDDFAGCWCRVVVRNRYSTKETLGPAPRFRRYGAVMIQVFAPVDTGRTDADTLAQAARAVYEGLDFDGVDCRAGNVREIGVDGRWYQVNVEVPFAYTESVTT